MNKRFAIKAAILSIFFLIMGPSLLIPALQSLAVAFPAVPFSTILLAQTLPCLILIPVAIISGALAGSRVKYKTLVVVGMILFVIGGVVPYFLNDFTAILIARVVFGIGIGIISPMGTALILDLFDGQERVNLLGTGNVFMMIGGIVLQMLGGILCSIGWRYTFLLHILAVIPLLIVLFYLHEPKKVTRKNMEKIKMPFPVYGYTIMFGVIIMLIYTMILNVSTIMDVRDLGTPASVGVVLSMTTVGGMLAGMAFGKVYKITSKFTIPLGMFISAGGLATAAFANSITILAVGTLITGIGFTTIMPAITMEIGAIVPPAGVGVASGILTAMLNGGMFFSPYFMTFVQRISHQSSFMFPIFVSMISIAAGGIFYIVFLLKKAGNKSPINELQQ